MTQRKTSVGGELVAKGVEAAEWAQTEALEESVDGRGRVVFLRPGRFKLAWYPHAPRSTVRSYLALVDVPVGAEGAYSVGITTEGGWRLLPEQRADERADDRTEE